MSDEEIIESLKARPFDPAIWDVVDEAYENLAGYDAWLEEHGLFAAMRRAKEKRDDRQGA